MIGLFAGMAEKQFPFEMKFGDETEWKVVCNPIELVIQTDRGDATYQFK
jgi:hypothetical protein